MKDQTTPGGTVPVNLDKLLMDYHTGDILPEDMAVLGQWADGSPQNRQLLELLGGCSDMGADVMQMYEFDMPRVWKAVSQARRRRKAPAKRRTALRYASVACFLLLSGLGYRLYRDYSQELQDNYIVSDIGPGVKTAMLELSDGSTVELDGAVARRITEAEGTVVDIDGQGLTFFPRKGAAAAEVAWNTVSVPAGGEYSFTMADGTRVWLNSGSSIRFPVAFRGDAREVEMTGEVYFEVTHDRERPFVVQAGGQRVEVLGTSFNISAYPDDPDIETTLLTGKVAVVADGKQTILQPGQQTRFDHGTGVVTIHNVDAGSYAAWTEGVFVFFDEPVESICRKLSRWYNIGIDASSATLKDLRYSGAIRRHDSFNKTAELLASTGEIFFQEKDGTIKVFARN